MNEAAGNLVYVRCGRGRRVAHLDRQDPVNLGWRGSVWIDAAHRWSRSTWIRPGRILDLVDRRDPVARRAIAAAAPGRPRCRHVVHNLPFRGACFKRSPVTVRTGERAAVAW